MAQVKGELALEAVAVAEGLEVTEEEINAEMERMAAEYGMEIEKIKKALGDSDDLKMDLLLRKARQLVLDNAKVKAARKPAAKKAAEEADAETEEKPKKKTAAKKAEKTEE